PPPSNRVGTPQRSGRSAPRQRTGSQRSWQDSSLIADSAPRVASPVTITVVIVTVMPRPADPIRRPQLLDGALDDGIANGISDLSLRPLAEALDTQAPVLLHHFGTKERLIQEVLHGVRTRLRAIARTAEASTPRSGLGTVWEWASAPEHQQLMRLFF